MFVIQWVYALANIVVALLLFLYIGRTSPGLPKGDFHLLISCVETLSFMVRSCSHLNSHICTRFHLLSANARWIM